MLCISDSLTTIAYSMHSMWYCTYTSISRFPALHNTASCLLLTAKQSNAVNLCESAEPRSGERLHLPLLKKRLRVHQNTIAVPYLCKRSAINQAIKQAYSAGVILCVCAGVILCVLTTRSYLGLSSVLPVLAVPDTGGDREEHRHRRRSATTAAIARPIPIPMVLVLVKVGDPLVDLIDTR
jgi:hypothetical protein